MGKDKVLLSEMKSGEKGRVINFFGGARLRKKFNSLGFRKGKEIKIISNMLFNGPITVSVDQTKIAVGRGMAGKVLIQKIT